METECVIHGRTITPEEVEGVRKLLRDHPDWSRLRLSREVCAAWDWRLPAPSEARQAGNAKGELRDIACRTVLLRLHRGGRIDLPAPRHAIDNRRRPVAWTPHDATPVRLPLRELAPLEVSIPRPGSADAKLFRFLLERHHYLGLSHVPGENIGHLVCGAGDRELACVLFAAACLCVPPDCERPRSGRHADRRRGRSSTATGSSAGRRSSARPICPSWPTTPASSSFPGSR